MGYPANSSLSLGVLGGTQPGHSAALCYVIDEVVNVNAVAAGKESWNSGLERLINLGTASCVGNFGSQRFGQLVFGNQSNCDDDAVAFDSLLCPDDRLHFAVNLGDLYRLNAFVAETFVTV